MKINNLIKKVFPERKKVSQKKDYGHVLVVAGSKGMSGAGVMASLAALRTGSGLVTLAVPKSIQDVCAVQVPEVMMLGLDENRNGTITAAASKAVLNFAEKRRIDFIACGPGLGVSEEVLKFVVEIVTRFDKGVLLDADALNCLGLFGVKSVKTEFDFLKGRSGGTIITPHPGEMARMLHCKPADIQKARERYARNFARLNKVVCVLKGFETVVSDGGESYINKSGNPGMATAGSGDVLSGIISGIAGQSSDLYPSACAGVYLHGMAGDRAVEETGEASLIATDIIKHLPGVIKKIEGGWRA